MSPRAGDGHAQAALAARASRPVVLRTPTGDGDRSTPPTAGLALDVDATVAGPDGLHAQPRRRVAAPRPAAQDQPLRISVDDARLDRRPAAGRQAPSTPPSARDRSRSPAATSRRCRPSRDGRWRSPQTAAAVVAGLAPQGRRSTRSVGGVRPTARRRGGPPRGRRLRPPGRVRSADGARSGRSRSRLQPAAFAPAVSLQADAPGHGSSRRCDGASASCRMLRAAAPGVEKQPRRRHGAAVGGRPAVVPAVVGDASDDVAGGPAAVLPALTSPDADRDGRSPVRTQPKVTTAEAEVSRATEVVSTFTHRVPGQPAAHHQHHDRRAHPQRHLRRAGRDSSASTASSGSAPPAKGYQKAPVINGGRLETDYGGGISQVSTTIFNAAFFAGVRIEQHTPHSLLHLALPRGPRGDGLLAGRRQQVDQRHRLRRS